MKPVLIFGALIILGLGGLFLSTNLSQRFNLNREGESMADFHHQDEVVNDVDLRIEPEGAKIDLDLILSGCPRQDCIPSIDSPQFETTQAADKWLQPNDRVFILTYQGETRIYPQKIMNWHEIVNDWFGPEEEPTPIAVTFCPLCGTALAFERRVDGVITEFGVSGKLHNSDLIMYDRYEGSLWQQITGEAITGPAARRNEQLVPLFLVTLEWDQAQSEFPDSQVLSRETGELRDYDYYPYGSYEQSEGIGFGAENDARMHPKTWVLGVNVNSTAKAYREDDLLGISSMTDQVGGVTVTIRNDDGVISFENAQTGEEIVPLRSFWFAWASFNPGTLIYEAN